MKLFVLIGTIALCSAFAAAGSSTKEQFRAASLKMHNQLRAKHLNTPPMKQDADLNKRAQWCADYYAKKGTIDHSCPYKNGAGENLHWASGGNSSPAARVQQAAKNFYNEIKDYSYSRPGFNKKTGHFTELVWVKATKLGTGYAKKGNAQFVVNLYKAHGNFANEFKQNVKRLKSSRGKREEDEEEEEQVPLIDNEEYNDDGGDDNVQLVI